MEGFFPSSSTLGQASASPGRTMLPACGACRLHIKCTSPKFKPYGEGRKGILIVLESPTSSEDESGECLNGNAGLLLRKMLATRGIDAKRDCWVTYAAICHTSSKKPAERSMFARHCSPNLRKTIDELKPSVILPMGLAAVFGVVSLAWTSQPEDVSPFYGYVIPSQYANAWICPMPSAADLLRTYERERPLHQRYLAKCLDAALSKVGTTPWPDGPPDYKSQVEVVLDPDRAVALLRRAAASPGIIAFDYEANALKPEWAESRLVSASVSVNGIQTFAYLLHGEAIEATKELLDSGRAVIASNMKYEQRWTRRKLGIRVRNWALDTMLAAHVLDNRRGTKSIKFLAFALLGQRLWDENIAPFLKSKEHEHINRIDQIELRELLLYNGLDSLLEYRVAEIQYPLIFGKPLKSVKA